jgi:hypothetical protein
VEVVRSSGAVSLKGIKVVLMEPCLVSMRMGSCERMSQTPEFFSGFLSSHLFCMCCLHHTICQETLTRAGTMLFRLSSSKTVS